MGFLGVPIIPTVVLDVKLRVFRVPDKFGTDPITV
jgi:hypothetical protein